jgi:tagatose 6-phosphate kinase
MKMPTNPKFITVVTLNPALGKNLAIRNFKIRGTYYTEPQVDTWIDGKGIISAHVLKTLGQSPIVCGFIGGVVGDYITKELDKREIAYRFAHISESTRQVYTIFDPLSKKREPPQIQINEKGPKVSDSEVDELINVYSTLLDDSQFVVILGSLPVGAPPNLYANLIDLANKKSVKVLLDSSDRDAMYIAMKAKPFIIKQNIERSTKYLGIPTDNIEDAKNAVLKLSSVGAEWTAITMGAKGAIVKKGKQVWRVIPPKVEVANTIGCGDSFAAGLITGILNNLSDENIIRLAVSSGTANTLSSLPGHALREEILNIIPNVKVLNI